MYFDLCLKLNEIHLTRIGLLVLVAAKGILYFCKTSELQEIFSGPNENTHAGPLGQKISLEFSKVLQI